MSATVNRQLYIPEAPKGFNQSPGLFSTHFNTSTEFIDRITKAVEWVIRALNETYKNLGLALSESANNFLSAIVATRSVIGFTRLFCSLAKVLSITQLIYKHNSITGERVPKTVVDENTGLTIVKRDAQGNIEWKTRSYIAITQDLCILAARALSAPLFLAKYGAIQLGAHARAMGTTVMGLYAGVTFLECVSVIHGLVDDINQGKDILARQIADLVSMILDTVALLWDLEICMHNSVGIYIGSVAVIASSLFYGVKELVYYNDGCGAPHEKIYDKPLEMRD